MAISEQLVGRADELGSIDLAPRRARRGAAPPRSSSWASPGSARRALLAELAARGRRARDSSCSRARRSELERDLPFWVFVDALDEYLRGPRPAPARRRWTTDVRAELAHVFPSLSAPAPAPAPALQHERYRSHRAVRDAARAAGSDEAARARPRRPPLGRLRRPSSCSARCCTGRPPRPCCSRSPCVPARCRSGSRRARAGAPRRDAHPHRARGAHPRRGPRAARRDGDGATRDRALRGERRQPLLPRAARPRRSTAQTATRDRARSGRSRWRASRSRRPSPPRWPRSSALLSDGARLVLEGAAVAGDPFEPELAAAAAGDGRAAAMDALDELLRLDLVRPTDVPRRFRFRHPLVRRAVYEATPGGWRLGAHERVRRGARERAARRPRRAPTTSSCSARHGDAAAVAVLREAGEAAAQRAPASAARWFDGALRLLSDRRPAGGAGRAAARAGGRARRDRPVRREPRRAAREHRDRARGRGRAARAAHRRVRRRRAPASAATTQARARLETRSRRARGPRLARGGRR